MLEFVEVFLEDQGNRLALWHNRLSQGETRLDQFRCSTGGFSTADPL
jgi:hypothetical protein